MNRIATITIALALLATAARAGVDTVPAGGSSVAGYTGTAWQASEIDNGDSGSADTIDWTQGNNQKSTLTAGVTYSFTDPPGPAHLTLKMVQDSAGAHGVSWPASVQWEGGSEPGWVTDAGAVNLLFCYFDGSSYHCSAITGSQ